jgi:hypothetical protein
MALITPMLANHKSGGTIMHPPSPKRLALLGFAAAALILPISVAHAQSATPAPTVPAPAAAVSHPIPQSLRIEHAEDREKLELLSKRPGKVGEIARKAIALFDRHASTEAEYIMPPLTLLPILADGKVTPDMAWAVAMTDRVRASREQIFQQHVEVTDVLIQLVAAAETAKDNEAKEFAEAAAGDAMNDVEILEPTVLVIGDYIRMKLAAGH